MSPELPDDADAAPGRPAVVATHDRLEADPAFDAVVRVAARLFDVPMAFAGLFDADRIDIESSIGMDLPDPAGQRASSGVLAVTRLLQAGQRHVVIEDLALDSRFAGDPLLSQEPAVRFVAVTAIVDEEGEVLGGLGVLDTRARRFDRSQGELLQDLSVLALRALQARQRGLALERLPRIDPLTGALDRHQFDQTLDVELRHAMRTGEGFAVLRLDLDGFGDINTAYGQAAGDAVLREVGRRLHHQVRLGDLLARLGSDDFGIVMRHGGEAEAQMLATRIVTALRQPITLGERAEEVSPGVSIGVAAYSDRIASVAELLAEADVSMQQARAQKESRWLVFGRLFEGAPDLRLVGND